MTCSCPTRITARILNATAATFHALHFAKLSGWQHIESSLAESVSPERFDIVMVGYGDRARVEQGLRELVPNAVEVAET